MFWRLAKHKIKLSLRHLPTLKLFLSPKQNVEMSNSFYDDFNASFTLLYFAIAHLCVNKIIQVWNNAL